MFRSRSPILEVFLVRTQTGIGLSMPAETVGLEVFVLSAPPELANSESRMAQE